MSKCTIDHTQPDQIPLFLCATCNIRPSHKGGSRISAAWVDPVAEKQAQLRAKQAETAAQKRKSSLQKHLDKHEFEKWDAKSKSWVRDEAKIAAHHAKMEKSK